MLGATLQGEIQSDGLQNEMAGAAGLEPVTSAVTGQRSNQLSYAPANGTAKITNDAVPVNGCFAL